MAHKLDLAWAEKSKADLLAILSNFRRIQSKSDLGRVLAAARFYRESFYKQVVTYYLNDVDAKGNLSDYAEKRLRTSAWDLYIALETPGATSQVKNMSDEQATTFATSPETTKWADKIRRESREFFKLFTGVFSSEYPTSAVPSEEQMEIAGVPVKIVGYDDRNEHQRNYFDYLQASVRVYIGAAKKSAPWLVRNQLPIIVDFAHKGLGVAARYNTDHVWVRASALERVPAANVRMLAHEMAHHWYAHLSSAAQADWGQMVHGDYTELDLKALLDAWPVDMKYAYQFSESVAESDPILALQVDVLSHEYKGGHELDSREDFEAALASGKPVHVPASPITGYAGKNAEESFCEAVGMFVAYGPRAVHERVRRWLADVIPGQVVASVIRRAKTLVR